MTLKPRTLFMAALGAAQVAALLVVTFRPDPVPVDLSALARAPMRQTVDVDGRTRIREVFDIASPIAGTARRAPVRVGDRVVAQETVVAVVEPVAPSLLDARSRSQAEAAVREAEASRNVAESELRQAQEDLAYAQSQFDRVKALVDRGVTSLVQLEDAAQQLAIHKAALETAQSRLEMTTGALERARAALIEPGGTPGPGADCCIRITAPITGTVLSIDEVSERPVAAGTLLLSVGDPTDLEIVADILSTDAVRIGPGARANVERWGGPGVLEARLRSIQPSARTVVSALGIEEQRVDAVFDLVTPPDERPGLGDGFSVFLRVVEWQQDDVLQIPLSAIFRIGDSWAAFVARDGRARQVQLTLGRRNDSSAQVLEGLDSGARVITHPGDAVADGVRIVERAAL